jgi:hypothetical protein
MEKENQIWNEYHSLREEIRVADSLNCQIMGIIIGAVALILTTGVGQAKPSARVMAFLCSYVVTYPGYRLLQGNRRRIWRISTYIRTFLEPNLGFVKWETRLSKQREISTDPSRAQQFSTLISQNELFIITLLNSVAGTAAIIYIWKLEYGLTAKIVSGLAIVGLNWYLWIKTSRQEKHLEGWAILRRSLSNLGN